MFQIGAGQKIYGGTAFHCQMAILINVLLLTIFYLLKILEQEIGVDLKQNFFVFLEWNILTL